MTDVMHEPLLWQTKLAARIHDPAEKALVLLRDPAGHEGGTSRALQRLLGLEQLTERIDPDNDEAISVTLFKNGLPRQTYLHVQRADWWSAAADRPQWPMEAVSIQTTSGEQKTLAVAPWAQVHWAKHPVLVHPLTGAQVDLGSLSDTDINDLKQCSFDHFSRLLGALGAQETNAEPDWRKILLAFWRFGPELAETDDDGKLGVLWPLLPADTRVPDHSIWDHLDLTSAFAGAFAADPHGEAALLALSIGPVQGFIATARSTSDLWAGSHLLSRLAWEAMRPICEALGPDAILFPRLRGIPQVDLWLRDHMGLPPKLFSDCEWRKAVTDANPLFSAALPNRLVAVVPASRARDIAEDATKAVRKWLAGLGEEVVRRLLDAAGVEPNATPTPFEQMREQLAGFPEVYWAAVPFSLIRCRDETRQRDLDPAGLLAAMAPMYGAAPGQPCGFLDTPAWKVLARDIAWSDDITFFSPNPGVLYPAVYDLAERVMAAAKATRAFDQTRQEGWRDSLSGEVEWLTTDRAQLNLPPGMRRDTLWTRIAKCKPAWAKEGEHLGALSAIKRLWPSIFAEEVSQAIDKEVGRFVVSTHTMALASQLDLWLERGGHTASGAAESLKAVDPVALPRKLTRRHGKNPALADAKRLPALLEAARGTGDEEAMAKAQRLLKQTFGTALGREEVKLEAYYALVLMDGDRMGAILSGDDETSITYYQSFHPRVQRGFDQHAQRLPLIQSYGQQKRPVSPNRHLAISGALNDFSQAVARHVVEEEHLGRVIYAGGDDVLAMLPVADLLSCMQRLRHAYSGTLPEDEAKDWGDLRKDPQALHCKSGYAWLRGRLMRMMGHHATASAGAVIAHHQAPLAAVLRELRLAEKRAKGEGGRDAFSITVIKRSGGALNLTAKWGEPLALLGNLIDFLRHESTSRRAVYHSLQWLHDLPQPTDEPAMLETLLAYQLARQSGSEARGQAPALAARLTALAVQHGTDGRSWLANFLSVAEFLARETRGKLQSTFQPERQAA